MFKFLKNIMNNEEVNLTNDTYSLHRILKTDLKKDPNVEEDEIIFGIDGIDDENLKYRVNADWDSILTGIDVVTKGPAATAGSILIFFNS